MYALSPYMFVHIGLIIRLLRHASGIAISVIISESDKLANELSSAGFAVSSQGLYQLKEFIGLLREDANKDRAITAAEVTKLSGIMSVLEQMVFAEAETKRIYIVTETRFSLDSLLNKPEQMFSGEVYGRLPPQVTFDIAEGFKCIVFSRATAAAFHLLRATEGTLREYYLKSVKRARVKVLNWGNMTQHMARKKRKDASLISRLDYIRTTYRNPTSHPEAKYELEQAQDLLGLCTDVVSAMAASFAKAPIGIDSR